ncbi:hypothetical protein GCM10023187_55420 [Nibrella viscosa]|uniref:Uncharacterized protein n=1 Tax=Nibrella viscosa TaxID=1084524 RepID=A0ABP8L1H4_9BACT
MKYLYWGCVVLLILALGRQSSGYYTFLRIAVFIGALVAAKEVYTPEVKIFTYIFLLIAILFNPILPVYLYSKGAWVPIDLMAAGVFAIKAYLTEDKNATVE